LTTLGMGELSYRQGNHVRYLTVFHGYAEVLPDRVIVLADIGERAEEIDLSRAKSARNRAEQRLSKPGDTDIDWSRAALALERAVVRMQVAAKGGAAVDHE
jgi:F-type H+-transporting ATPase subunit epsilon